MNKFTLYCSGIPYAQIDISEEGIYHEQLDITTASYLPRKELTEEDSNFYQELSNMNLLHLYTNWHLYEEMLSSMEENIIIESQEHYQKASPNLYVQRYVKYPNNIYIDHGKIYAIVVPAREIVAVLVKKGYEEQTILHTWKQMYPVDTLSPVQFLGSFQVETRDHVHLATDVFLPANQKNQLPAILVRTPYGKEEYRSMCYRFVQRGYALVLQDVRGRHDSEGDFLPEHYEVEDGDDTLTWIASQPWSNQKIGMTGGSYLGYVQWAAAASKNPYLKAITSFVCAGSAFMDLPRSGGCLSAGTMAWAFAMSEKTTNMELMKQSNWDELLDIRPLEDIAKRALGHDIYFLNEWLKHKDYDDFWKASNWLERGAGCQVPSLIVSGWFDDDGMGTTEALELTKDYPKGMRKIILGPWQHSGNAHYDIHGFPLGNNALRFDIDCITFQWLDHYLKAIENDIEKGATVEYYTMGENKWKSAEAWPIEAGEEFSLYLDSQANEAAITKKGVLSPSIPVKNANDQYLYDPCHPATHIIDMEENEIQVPENYTEEEKRADYLVYSTPPLSEAITITGDMLVELYVSSSAVDTDFFVRVCDVDEKGISYKLADGHLSARYRDGFTSPVWMEKDEIYQLQIHTSKLSMCFAKGHQIRLTITSSAKNSIFPNSNTKDGFNSMTTQIAENHIHHGPDYPSRLILYKEIKNKTTALEQQKL